MTQDDATWERQTFASLVDEARTRGLDPIVSPSGGAEFAGDGHPGPLPVKDWIERVRDTGVERLHLDHPRLRWTTVDRILDQWAGPTWLTIEHDQADYLDRLDADRLEVVAMRVGDRDARTGHPDPLVAADSFRTAAGRLDLVWVSASRIRSGHETDVGRAVRALAPAVLMVGVWAWMGSTGRGYLRSDRPALVQAAVDAALADALGTASATAV